MNIIITPGEFLIKHPIKYPAHSNWRMEDRIYDYLRSREVKSDWLYLPIQWDAYICKANFGKDAEMMGKLQRFVSKILKRHKGQKVFTICEYADGICVDAPGLHVMYCACDGGTALPLLCQEHEVNRSPEITASFMGELNYPIRKKMQRAVSGRNGYVIRQSRNTREYVDLMNKSYFALCPRGYGPTSYRLYEAIQIGCVPVYIYDTPILPFPELEWDKFCVLVHESEIDRLPQILEEKKAQYASMKYNCEWVYKNYFNIDSVCGWVKKWLEK